MRANSLKSALETEDQVPKAEHIDPFKFCLIRDDLHMRVHLCSKQHLITLALKEIRQTRAKRLLQWHTENGHENILFMDDKIFTIEEQYNNQINKIYAQKSLEVHSDGAERPSPFLLHGMVEGIPSGGDTNSLIEKGVKLVSKCIKRTCYKEL
jgi:hypothetical protein